MPAPLGAHDAPLAVAIFDAEADLLGADSGLAESHKLYACHDKLLAHKTALFDHLVDRWRDLFNVEFDVLLYDLTSTYFESDPPGYGKRKHGYSRDKRPDCVQVVIALIVTPEGFPLAYEVLPGNTLDKQTLADFLGKIETLYGKAERVWVMDRGIPTEETLEHMRTADPPVQYLVGTPKGRLTRLEKDLLGKPWQEARPGVQVKLLPQDNELYVFAESADRVAKERSMRRRRLKRLWHRLGELPQLLQPSLLDVVHHAADARVGRRQPRPAQVLDQIVVPLPILERVEEHGRRAEIDAAEHVLDGTGGGDLALRQDNDLIGKPCHLVDGVADVNDRHAHVVAQSFDVGQDFAFALLVERGDERLRHVASAIRTESSVRIRRLLQRRRFHRRSIAARDFEAKRPMFRCIYRRMVQTV